MVRKLHPIYSKMYTLLWALKSPVLVLSWMRGCLYNVIFTLCTLLVKRKVLNYKRTSSDELKSTFLSQHAVASVLLCIQIECMDE